MSLNDRVKMASDPFMPIFRSLRTAIMRNVIDPDFDASQPLNNYFFSAEKIKAMKAIQNSELDIAFPAEEIPVLKSQLAKRMALAAPELVSVADEINGDTYRELFANGLALLEKTYGPENTKWCGFNDNWVVEFLPLLARAFPEAKALIIVRDPRGAMASAVKIRDTRPENVPLLYSFAHHWRKHASFARMLMKEPSIKGRLMVFKYEDFCSDPNGMGEKVCDFLGVTFDQEMFDTSRFRPVRGDKWGGWSNFKVPEKGVYTDGIFSWRKHLDQATIEFIEFICDYEMRMFGYQPIAYMGGEPSDGVRGVFDNDDKQAIGWRNEHSGWEVEHKFEMVRKALVETTKESPGIQTIEENFLFEENFDQAAALGNMVP